jgi:hypothetical protein
MARHQEVTQVPGEQIWVETWSWSDSASPFLPFIYTRVGGEVNIWREKPPDREDAPLWRKILCSIPPFNFFCWIFAQIAKSNENKKKLSGNIFRLEIKLQNTYYDRAGIQVIQKDQICKNENSCSQEELAVGVGYIKYPKIGANLTPVVGVKTEATVVVGNYPPIHQTTWAGPIPLPP